jgi:RNA-directed DNA polymerase
MNAEKHSKKRYVLNVDLKDFFPTINFGRVRGMFMAYPFKFNKSVATVLAQICCFKNQLPQGAPSSPVVSNAICATLDRDLLELARKCRCNYSRYADDLTFSTSMPEFPKEVMADSSNRVIGESLSAIVRRNGFEINEKKIRFRTRRQRQVVTGLTANIFPNVTRRYVRQVRAMLHAWKKYGEELAQKEYFDRYCTRQKRQGSEKPNFRLVLIGRVNFIGMVKGKGSRTYRAFCRTINELAPELKIPMAVIKNNSKVLVFTEGKTDWKHLKKAKEKIGIMDDIRFSEDNEAMGDGNLLEACKRIARVKTDDKIIIFLFDRDKPGTVKQVCEEGKDHKGWGNGVYSMAIPVPIHRVGYEYICIEMYYSDDEIKTADAEGRRLFLSSEFRKSGRHKELPLTYQNAKRLEKENLLEEKRAKIISEDVYPDNEDRNVALSKNAFADLVTQGEDGFSNFRFEAFQGIFDVVFRISAEENARRGSDSKNEDVKEKRETP